MRLFDKGLDTSFDTTLHGYWASKVQSEQSLFSATNQMPCLIVIIIMNSCVIQSTGPSYRKLISNKKKIKKLYLYTGVYFKQVLSDASSTWSLNKPLSE